MNPILLDGSNVSLSGASSGKLTTLETLAQMVRCLLENGFTPYTVFDASFKYRTLESSIGRQDFNQLTKKLPRYFQMSPAGEEADLFLLQLAIELSCPIVSNDTFKKYGKMKGNCLSYDGQEIAVCNFQMFAGVIILPDLKIRRRIGLEEQSFANIAEAFSKPPPSAEAKMNSARDGPSTEQSKTNADFQPSISDDELQGMRKVINRFLKEGAKGGLPQLAPRLFDYRSKFLRESGLTPTSRRSWFGFTKFSDFLRGKFPDYEVDGDKISEKE